MPDDESPDRDEPIAIPLDPEDALRALMRVAPEGDPSAKDRTLDALRQAYPEDLALHGDRLRSDARRAGATPDEISDAESTHPRHPGAADQA